MKTISFALSAAMTLALVAAAQAQSAFDGLRFGIESTSSWNRMKLDGSKIRDKAINELEDHLASGAASLEGNRLQLEAGRAAIERGQADLDKATADLELAARHLSDVRKLADGFKAATGLPASPYDAAIESATKSVQGLEYSLAKGRDDLAASRAEFSQGEVRLHAGQDRFEHGIASLAGIRAVPSTMTVADNGFGGRLTLGYGRTVFRGLYVGIEGDIGMAEADLRISVPTRPEYRVSYGFIGGVSGRVGWVIHPRVMIYGAGGWEGTQWKVESGSKATSSFNHGARVGGGVEVHIGSGILLRAGYDRSLMGTASVAGASVTPSRSTLRLGIAKVF